MSSATLSITTAWPLCRISWQMVVSSFSSPPGVRPNAISSRTAQQIQRFSVTRATAAKPMPVERHTTSRIRGTAAMPCTAAMSAPRSLAMVTLNCPVLHAIAAGGGCREDRPGPEPKRRPRAYRAFARSRNEMGLSLPRRPVVLLVEDELLLRMDAAAMVAEAGFEVVEAGDADEAIAILEFRRDIGVVF